LITCAFVGCGSELPKTVPVTGTVTLDGTPLGGATVNLLSDEGSIPATGITDDSGNFTLKTMVGDKMVEGAKVGTHKIAVVKSTSTGSIVDMSSMSEEEKRKMVTAMAGKPVNTSEIKSEDLVPAKYKNPLQSGLVANVTQEGPNQIVLELSSK
jgi:hypothetical protein